MEHTNNQITIRGELETLPVLSHENHGQEFYRFILAVPRLSGTVDLLPVIAKGSVLSGLDPSAGDMITVTGQVRSHNQRTGGHGIQTLQYFDNVLNFLFHSGTSGGFF